MLLKSNQIFSIFILLFSFSFNFLIYEYTFEKKRMRKYSIYIADFYSLKERIMQDDIKIEKPKKEYLKLIHSEGSND